MRGSWIEYQRKVLSDIERLDDIISSIEKRMHDIEVAQAVHAIKVGVWGLLGGSIPIAIAIGLQYLRK